MRNDTIRISHYEKQSKVLGPGNRFVIWFQGCNKRCPGCINPEGQKINGGKLIEISKIISEIKNTNGIQGVTISGGEPFLQFSGLKCLVEEIKSETSLDIMLYSGYTYGEVKNKFSTEVCEGFFANIDIFVDGEYIDHLNNNQMFRGSGNQKIYYFTEKYRGFENQILSAKNRNVEFTILDNSEVFMLGIPPRNFYDELFENIKRMNADEEK